MTKTFQLPNGIRCVVEERPGTQKVAMEIAIRSGSLNEAPEEAGLNYLTAASLEGGTKTRSRTQIAEDIESTGGLFKISSERAQTTISAQTLARETESVFEVLADMLLNPAFDPVEIEKEKKKIEEEIDGIDQEPEAKNWYKFLEASFSDINTGFPGGTKEILSTLTPAQVRQKHREFLTHPENIVVSVSGDVDFAAIVNLASLHLGYLPSAATSKPAPQLSFAGQDIRENTANEKLYLTFGFKAPNDQSPEKYNFMLLQNVLAGGMSTPLFTEVRDKRGLVYGVHAGYTSIADQGLFFIEASTGPENARELISVCLQVLGNAVKNDFSQVDLDQARERIIRHLDARKESTDATCASHATNILKYQRVISPEETNERLKQVTVEDIRRAAIKLLESGEYSLAGIGPVDEIPTPAEIKSLISEQLKDVILPPPAVASAKQLTTIFTAAQNKSFVSSSPDPKMTVLPNGLRVVTLEREGSLTCGAWVATGSDHETPEVNGVRHMLEHMMFKGTPTYPAGTVKKTVEGEMGGGLNAYTNKDQTAYYIYNLLPNQLTKAIDICSEMVFEANLGHAEFDGKVTISPDGSTSKAKGERDVVIEEINMYLDMPDQRAVYIMDELAYPNQSHGRTIIGTEDTLRAMTVGDIAACRDEYYTSNNTVFIAVGPVKHEDFVQLIEEKHGHRQPVNCPPLPTPQYQGGTSALEVESATLGNIIFAVEGVSDLDDDSYAYQALAMILSGGASARLDRALIDEMQLASAVYIHNISYTNCGLLGISCSIQPENIRPLVSQTYVEIHKLLQNLSEDELRKAKSQMEMSVLSLLETNMNACFAYGQNVITSGKAETPAEISAKIQAVTTDDIKRVAQKILSSNPTLAMVVPPGTDPALLPTHEEVLAFRDGKQAPNAQNTPQAPAP